MVIGIGIVDIFIAESRSLKEKRGVLRRIIGRTQSKFSLSIAEIGHNDEWKRARIGFAIVGNDRSFINSRLDKVLQFIEGLHIAGVVDSRIELISMSDSAGAGGIGEGSIDEF